MICQVCDFFYTSESFFQNEKEDWIVAEFLLGEQVLQVLLCLDCAKLDEADIIDGYKKRIKEGGDVHYH